MYDFLSHLVFRRGHVHLEALPEGGVAVALGDGSAELGQDLEYYSNLKLFSFVWEFNCFGTCLALFLSDLLSLCSVALTIGSQGAPWSRVGRSAQDCFFKDFFQKKTYGEQIDFHYLHHQHQPRCLPSSALLLLLWL